MKTAPARRTKSVVLVHSSADVTRLFAEIKPSTKLISAVIFITFRHIRETRAPCHVPPGTMRESRDTMQETHDTMRKPYDIIPEPSETMHEPHDTMRKSRDTMRVSLRT